MKTKYNFTRQPCGASLRRMCLVVFLLVGIFMYASAAMAFYNGWGKKPNACAQTSKAALAACTSSATSDYWLGIGACDNLSDRQDKQDCIDEAQNSFKEDFQTCNEQFRARQEICSDLGAGPYDPDLDPTSFVDEPTDNEFFPLKEGSKYIYESESERIEVVVGGIATIADVQCRVVTDKVYDKDSNDLVEDTTDYYAQDNEGNVWYFGETTVAYTYDTNHNKTSASSEGSWIAGVDEAKPGIIMFAVPQDQFYRQEFLLGTAEDLGRVIESGVPAPNTSYTNCLHTQDSTPLEPGMIENKYYAPDVGLVLTIDPDGGQEVLTSYTPGS